MTVFAGAFDLETIKPLVDFTPEGIFPKYEEARKKVEAEERARLKAEAETHRKAEAEAKASQEAEESAKAEAEASQKAEAEAQAEAEARAAEEAEAAAKAGTVSQQNALRSAEDYLDYCGGKYASRTPPTAMATPKAAPRVASRKE